MMTYWGSKALGEVCLIKPPKAEAKSKIANGDEVSFAPMKDLGIGEKFLRSHQSRTLSDVSGSYTYFADGDVLLAKITPCFENGKLGIARGLKNGIGFGSSEFIVMRPAPELEAEFLYYYLARTKFLEEGARHMSGAVGHKRVTKEFIESYQIPLPSLQEQRRLVTLLDKAFDGIATAKTHAEQNLRNAKSLITTRLAQLFRPDHDMDRLADLAISISDGDHAPPPKASTGVPFITISNIDKENRQIDFSETFLVSQAYCDELKTHRRPQPGDVLYTVTGSFGIPVLVEEDRAFCFQRHIGLVRPKPDVDGKWLSYALLSPMAFAQADAGATGTAQRTVSLNVLRNMQIPKLSVEEQRRQARELDALATEVARLASIYQRKLTALAELQQSLLHQAFTGQL